MAKIFSNELLIIHVILNYLQGNTIAIIVCMFLVYLFLCTGVICPGNLDKSYFILLCKIFYLLQVVGVEQHSDRPNLMYLRSNLGNHL